MRAGDQSHERALLERLLDGPEQFLLWPPWPPTPRIILKGSLGFLRQILRSRRWRRRPPAHPPA